MPVPKIENGGSDHAAWCKSHGGWFQVGCSAVAAEATYHKKGLFGKEGHAKFYVAGVVMAFNHLHSRLPSSSHSVAVGLSWLRSCGSEAKRLSTGISNLRIYS